MTYKINNTTVIDNSRNVCACCVCSCCISATTQMIAPSGATGSRPASPPAGSLYFDTTEGNLVAYSGTEWVSAGGATEISTDIASFGSQYVGCFVGAGNIYRRECPSTTMHPLPNGGVATFSDMGCTGQGYLYNIQGTTRCQWFGMRYDGPDGSVYSSGAPKNNGNYKQICTTFRYRYLPYCGINDTSPEATMMMLNGGCCGTCGVCYITPWLARDGYWVTRDTGTSMNGLCTCHICDHVFGITNARYDYNSCAVVSYGDACCGLSIKLAGFHTCTCPCCFCCAYAIMLTGFKPCYFYSNATCSDAANSPMQVRGYCISGLFGGSGGAGFEHVKLDWCNKRVWFLSSISPGCCCGHAAIFCVCDKGFPDNQSCWCLHCAPICAYRFCLTQGSLSPCQYVPGHVSFFNNNRTELVVGNIADGLTRFPLTGGNVIRQTFYTYYSNCKGRLIGAYVDNSDNVRVIVRGSARSVQPACQGSFITELVWPSACNIFCTTPTKRFEFAFKCCPFVYSRTFCQNMSLDFMSSTACDAGFGPSPFTFDPISNKVTYTGPTIQGYPSVACCWLPARISWAMPPIPTNCTINKFLLPLNKVPQGLYVCTHTCPICTSTPVSSAGARGFDSPYCTATTAVSITAQNFLCSGIALCGSLICAPNNEFNCHLDWNTYSTIQADHGFMGQFHKLCETYW